MEPFLQTNKSSACLGGWVMGMCKTGRKRKEERRRRERGRWERGRKGIGSRERQR